MGFFSFLNRNNKDKQIQALLERGGVVVDVRTPQEFAQGHIKGAVNMPLQQLNSQIQKLKNNGKPVITCCRSGMRSASAVSILKSSGIECINGGAWENLNQIIKHLTVKK